MMNGHPAAEFQQTANQFNKMMMDSWSQWTKQSVSSDTFAAASSAYMDWSLATQRLMTDLSGQFMESLDMPRRSDLARLSAQVQSVETRLLDQEDSQEDLKEMLKAINAKLDQLAINAQAPAAPTREPKTEVSGAEQAKAETASTKAKTPAKRGKSK